MELLIPVLLNDLVIILAFYLIHENFNRNFLAGLVGASMVAVIMAILFPTIAGMFSG